MANRNLLPDIWRSERGISNPMREMNRLQRRINRIFDDFFAEPFSDLLPPAREILPLEREVEFMPACDVEETDSHYLLSFDLPGVKEDDVKLDIRDNLLTVSGERKEETRGRGSRERYHGSFSRSFTLPASVNADKVEATYENGVLQIALPKIAVSPSKQIPIKEGKLIEGKQGKTEKAA